MFFATMLASLEFLKPLDEKGVKITPVLSQGMLSEYCTDRSSHRHLSIREVVQGLLVVGLQLVMSMS